MRLAAIVPLSIRFVMHYELRHLELVIELSCARNLPDVCIIPYQSLECKTCQVHGRQ
jgi:hypothetical protein